MRGVTWIVVDRLVRRLPLRVQALDVPSVQISIPQWKVATRHVDTNPVALFKHIARREKLNVVFVNLSRSERFGFFPDRTPKSCPYNSFGKVVCRSVRVHIYKPDNKVSVSSRRRGVQFHGDRAGNLCILA